MTEQETIQKITIKPDEPFFLQFDNFNEKAVALAADILVQCYQVGLEPKMHGSAQQGIIPKGYPPLSDSPIPFPGGQLKTLTWILLWPKDSGLVDPVRVGAAVGTLRIEPEIEPVKHSQALTDMLPKRAEFQSKHIDIDMAIQPYVIDPDDKDSLRVGLERFIHLDRTLPKDDPIRIHILAEHVQEAKQQLLDELYQKEYPMPGFPRWHIYGDLGVEIWEESGLVGQVWQYNPVSKQKIAVHNRHDPDGPVESNHFDLLAPDYAAAYEQGLREGGHLRAEDLQCQIAGVQTELDKVQANPNLKTNQLLMRMEAQMTARIKELNDELAKLETPPVDKP